MASINQTPVMPQLRQPRALVKINDQLIDGWRDWEVEQNIGYYADTFTLSFVKSKLPADRDAVWFSQQELLYVEILAGFPADPDRPALAEMTSLIYGRVDGYTDDITGKLITLSGRDFTSLLIDTKSTAQFQNKTASQIATTLAEKHGLTPVVTATSEFVGQYLDEDHITMVELRSDWDWLTYLASQEDYVCFVTGKELHFEPAAQEGNVYLIDVRDSGGIQSSNALKLSASRNLSIAKGVTVTVRGTDPSTLRGFSVSYPLNPKTITPGRAKIGNERLNYAFNVTGKTRAQAEKIAEQRFQQITRHEKQIAGQLPGDVTLDCRKLIQVQGTGTDFDQTYYPVTVTRSMAFGEGLTMQVTAQNVSPEPRL